jgi:di/tricarboxylate transporter
MSSDMLIVLLILAGAILFFITEWLRVDVVALIVVVSLMISGVLTAQEAISGFSNSAVLTIASLFVVGGGVLQTGVAGWIGERILKIAGKSPLRLTVSIMLAVAILSGFMSDTGTVAVLLPAIIGLAWKAKLGPSKLLMPLSYGSLLGGAATLIGTPPNIIVSDLLRESGLRPFQFFDYTPLGLVLIIAGILYMVFIGRRLLPEHPVQQEIQRIATPAELATLYQLPNSLFRLRVRGSSSLVGKSLVEANLRQDFSVTVLEIQRYEQGRTMAKLGNNQLVLQSGAPKKIVPSPNSIFEEDDVLIVQGTADDVSHMAASWNLGVQPADTQDAHALNTEEVGLAEVLLPPRSDLIGKTLVELNFGSTHHLTVLGIRRAGSEGHLDLKTSPLRFGDVLLVQGSWSNILALRKQRRDFVVMGQPEEMIALPARKKAPIAALILLGMLVAMILDVFPLATTSMLAGLLMILTGCLTIDDAYGVIDWKSIVLVAGMLPMSIALERVGVVNLVAQGLTTTLGNWGPVWVLAGLFFLTSLFTQVLSNTATTVLIAPIGLAAAIKLGVQPQAFMMGVAVAASMAMASPVASPVNTLVMGAGNYRFSDYIKVGTPLIFILLILSVLLLPIIWPF